MDRPTEFPQHERLTSVLNIYRSAMRQHIAKQWSKKYPEDWFSQLLENLDGKEQDDIKTNRDRIQKQKGEGTLALSDDEENQLVMDILMFLNAIKDRQDLFHKLTDREVTDDIKWLYEIRNRWAHPPLHDLSKSEVDNAVERCANVLQIFDENAKNAVLNLFERRAEPSSLKAIQEQINQIFNLLFGPVERQQETLVGLSEAVISLQASVADIKGQLSEDTTVDPEGENLAEQLQPQIASIETTIRANLQTMQEQLSGQISEVKHGVWKNRDQIKDTELWRSSLVDPVAKIQKEVQHLANLVEQGMKTAASNDVLRDE